MFTMFTNWCFLCILCFFVCQLVVEIAKHLNCSGWIRNIFDKWYKIMMCPKHKPWRIDTLLSHEVRADPEYMINVSYEIYNLMSKSIYP